MALAMAKASTPTKRGETTAKPRAGQSSRDGATAATRAKPPRDRGGEARSIADLIPQVSGTAFRKFGFVQSSILTRWTEIVGNRLAKVTAAESLRFPRGKQNEGILYINVSGAHAVVVQHAIPDIITRVNSFFGYAAVSGVRLKQGRVARAPAAPSRGGAAAKPAAQAAAAVQVEPATSAGLKKIADPELRTVLEALALSLAQRDAQDKSD